MIRIAIFDDHAMVRTGLRGLLSEEPDLQVVAEGASGREVVDIVRTSAPDVILLDISMPGQNGIEALRAIKARAPKIAVLILSGFPEENYAATLMRQGASGYLNKDCDPMDIVEAIRMVSRGRKYITPGVAEQLADVLSGVPSADSHGQLSERELQVFVRLAKGETTSQVANGMALGQKTVSSYRSRVMEKLSLKTNSELTYYAMKHGLIQ